MPVRGRRRACTIPIATWCRTLPEPLRAQEGCGSVETTGFPLRPGVRLGAGSLSCPTTPRLVTAHSAQDQLPRMLVSTPDESRVPAFGGAGRVGGRGRANTGRRAVPLDSRKASRDDGETTFTERASRGHHWYVAASMTRRTLCLPVRKATFARARAPRPSTSLGLGGPQPRVYEHLTACVSMARIYLRAWIPG